MDGVGDRAHRGAIGGLGIWCAWVLVACVSLLGGCGAGSGGSQDAGRPDGGALDGGDGAVPDGDAGGCPLPSDGLYATFDVVGQIFHAQITDASAITQALALWQGQSTASIPNGALVCTAASWNCGYGWHLDPADIVFADFTIEICDGTPSYVEANCSTFGARYCPWSAQLVELRDCRQDPSCPAVPK